jgi:HK97 gp10 family phage protein
MSVRGGKEMIAAFQAEVKLLADQELGREVLREALEPMAERMRENLEPHRRSGKTIEDVDIMDAESPAPGVAAVAVGLSAGKSGRDFVGRFLEFGTEKQAAAPWARPAIDAEEPKLLDGIAGAYQKRLMSRG